MSLTGLSKMYEKMLEKPGGTKSSSGTIKQPTPDGVSVNTGEDLNSDEAAYLASVDQRMALRKEGKRINESETVNDVSRIMKLEKDVVELKELMTEMMRTHLKLLEKSK